LPAKNDFTEAILSVMGEYRRLKKDSRTPANRTPPVMVERQRGIKDPIQDWIEQHGVKKRHVEGLF
jgi:hypothetical protein